MLNFFTDHPFWGLLTLACVGWYSTVTVFVAWRGIRDIRNMLRRLAASGGEDDADRS